MKVKFYVILILFMSILTGCYEVPNNFPKAEFYSYIPYQDGNTIRFANEGDTIVYEVAELWNEYTRGKTNCKCGKEFVYRYVSLTNLNSERGEQVLFFSIDCTDRAVFRINLWAKSLNASYVVDYTDEDVWAISYDETKIFKSFVDEITLLQDDNPIALVKKGQGIVWFIDSNGTTWNSCK